VADFLLLDDDGNTDHVGSRSEIKQKLLGFTRSREDWWFGQKILELGQSLIYLWSPHELLLVLE
jgi:hypothetical protein